MELLDLALAQLPVATTVEDPAGGVEILARADSAGCTHGFLDAWPRAAQLVAAFDRLDAIDWRDAHLRAVGLRT